MRTTHVFAIAIAIAGSAALSLPASADRICRQDCVGPLCKKECVHRDRDITVGRGVRDRDVVIEERRRVREPGVEIRRSRLFGRGLCFLPAPLFDFVGWNQSPAGGL
jgi:hypothetical protein